MPSWSHLCQKTLRHGFLETEVRLQRFIWEYGSDYEPVASESRKSLFLCVPASWLPEHRHDVLPNIRGYMARFKYLRCCIPRDCQIWPNMFIIEWTCGPSITDDVRRDLLASFVFSCDYDYVCHLFYRCDWKAFSNTIHSHWQRHRQQPRFLLPLVKLPCCSVYDLASAALCVCVCCVCDFSAERTRFNILEWGIQETGSVTAEDISRVCCVAI
jgi:hypothetical protein